jgi:hypothetical protein
MRWRIAVFGTLGALATIVGAVLVLAPRLLLGVPQVRTAIASLTAGPKAVMTAAATIVGLYVLATARSSPVGEVPTDTAAEQRFDAAATDPPETVTADRRSLTGAGLDADVQVAVADGGQPLRAVRDLLRGLAVDAYTDDPRRTDEARHAVDTGAWTDDSHAAVFLAGDDGPTPSLLSRIRLWLVPERERERRIEATITAIERLQEER